MLRYPLLPQSYYAIHLIRTAFFPREMCLNEEFCRRIRPQMKKKANDLFRLCVGDENFQSGWVGLTTRAERETSLIEPDQVLRSCLQSLENLPRRISVVHSRRIAGWRWILTGFLSAMEISNKKRYPISEPGGSMSPMIISCGSSSTTEKASFQNHLRRVISKKGKNRLYFATTNVMS